MRSWRDAFARHLGLDEELRFEVYRSVAASATLRDATYWLEILFAAGIATLGLTLGSPAVIIGAMLISPLMGPILAAGLSLAAGDFLLAVRSGVVIVISSLTAILFSTLLVVLLPFREMTQEIAARTQPNTLDLVIALFSGAVGALAVSKSLRGVATSIPGVAIAVALMPPLCVTGYGLGVLLTVDRVQGLNVLRGGSLLFVTNLVAITFASMLLFLALHIDADAVRDRIRNARPGTSIPSLPPALGRIGSLPARLLLAAAMLVLVALPLARSFDALVKEIRSRQQQNQVQRVALETWEEMFARSPDGRARSFTDRIEVSEENGRLQVSLRVFISTEISLQERNAFLRAVARELGRATDTINLSLIEVPTSEYRVASGKAPAPTAAVVVPLRQRLQDVSEEIRRFAAATRMPQGAWVAGVEVTIRSARARVVVVYVADRILSEDAVELIRRDLNTRLALPEAQIELSWIPRTVAISFPRADAERIGPLLRSISAAVSEHELRAELATAPEDPGSANAALELLTAAGLPVERLTRVESPSVARGSAQLVLRHQTEQLPR